MCDGSVGPRSSLFAIYQPYFIAYDQFSYIFMITVYRVAFNQWLWVRPMFGIIQSVVSMGVLFYTVPFYRKRANSFFAGITVSRFLGYIPALVCATINLNNDQTRGIILGSICLGAILFGFIIGFIGMELYILFLWRRVERYSEEIPKMSPKVYRYI
jgi:hypothetical protein